MATFKSQLAHELIPHMEPANPPTTHLQSNRFMQPNPSKGDQLIWHPNKNGGNNIKSKSAYKNLIQTIQPFGQHHFNHWRYLWRAKIHDRHNKCFTNIRENHWQISNSKHLFHLMFFYHRNQFSSFHTMPMTVCSLLVWPLNPNPLSHCSMVKWG